MKNKWPTMKVMGEKIPYLFPYVGRANSSYVPPEADETEKAEVKKLDPRIPKEPPTIVSAEEIHRREVRAGKGFRRGNSSRIIWQSKPAHTVGNNTNQIKTAIGSHTNSVGGVTSNLGEGNNWVRPHKPRE